MHNLSTAPFPIRNRSPSGSATELLTTVSHAPALTGARSLSSTREPDLPNLGNPAHVRNRWPTCGTRWCHARQIPHRIRTTPSGLDNSRIDKPSTTCAQAQGCTIRQHKTPNPKGRGFAGRDFSVPPTSGLLQGSVSSGFAVTNHPKVEGPFQPLS